MKDIKSIHAIAGTDRLVAEFEVRMSRFLPFCRLKIRIYHTPGEKKFCGYTNIEMIRKYDGYPEGACGMGHTVEETLKDTISGFLKMIEEDYPLQTYPKGVPRACLRNPLQSVKTVRYSYKTEEVLCDGTTTK